MQSEKEKQAAIEREIAQLKERLKRIKELESNILLRLLDKSQEISKLQLPKEKEKEMG